jgi:hypothetical protein
MPLRTASVVALALALAPLAARAQRYTAGVAGVYAQPLGEFGQNVRRGFGLDGFGTLGLDSRGIFSLRAELGYLGYSTKTEPFYESNGYDYVELESETKSGVLTLGIGPQLMAPSGPVRPYAAATIGLARFATETAINLPARSSSSGTNETLYKETLSSDWVRSLAATGGLAFQLSFFGKGILGDLGVRYHRNGLARYVSPEGVQYNGTETPTVTATESEADFVVYRLGILIPIR